MKMRNLIDGAIERGYFGPCAKQTTRCTIVTVSGEKIVGENWCMSPQEKCPRLEGEDYTKCKTICKQIGHAEVVAIGLAEERAEGSTAILEGHTYYCMNCQHALFDAGVISLKRR